MTNISTGRQRGIVPFVDETTGRLPDQYIPQRIIDLQGDLEQAVTDASASATAASQSASQAQSSATTADSSARAASASSESAKTASDSATSSKDAAAQSASQASASAQAAETSKTNAATSAQAAETSKTNAASSASAAKVSETNAAASATAAQQAVDGFGLEVGTTTTGNSGTDAVVEIQKTGTKYTANFTIPRGNVGPAGVNENVPLGSTSGVVAQAKDAYPTLPRKVQVHGRTVENLCPVFNNVNNGVTFSTDANGYISIKGTATDDIYEQPRIANMPPNTKVWIYVDSDFIAKGINGVYAQSSGWNVYASPNKVVSSTTTSATDGSLVINIAGGVTVDTKIRVMFVASETEPDTNLFVPSGVNTVKPTKLVAAGKNLLSYPAANSSQFEGALTLKNEANGPVKIHVDMATNYQGQFYSDLNIPIPAGTYTISYGDNPIKGLQMAVKFSDGSRFEIGSRDTVSKKTSTFTGPKTITQFYIQMKNNEKMGDFTVYPMLELGSTKSDWEACETVEAKLPSDISLADGDTLTIDRDGTTQILHTDGEPTVLDNVTLPELPAPTFNVYTTGGYVLPTVDVTYERDVNLALDHEIPHDATLVGNGTKSSPLGVGDLSSRYTPTTTTTALDTRVKALEMIDGTFINPISKSGDDADADSIAYGKIYRVNNNWKNIPKTFIGGYLLYGVSGNAHFQLLFGYSDGSQESVYIRQGWASIGGRQWRRLIKEHEYLALEARVQALEEKLSN